MQLRAKLTGNSGQKSEQLLGWAMDTDPECGECWLMQFTSATGAYSSPTVEEADAELKMLPKTTRPEKDALWRHCLCVMLPCITAVTGLKMSWTYACLQLVSKTQSRADRLSS